MSDEKKQNQGFDPEVEVDSSKSERVMLPEGPAVFVVEKTTRKREDFSKYGVTIIVSVDLMVSTMEPGYDSQRITVNLPCLLTFPWFKKYLDFFASIGQRKHGDKGMFTANWVKAIGATGTCILEHREYESKKTGEMVKICDVKEFTAEAAPADDNLKF